MIGHWVSWPIATVTCGTHEVRVMLLQREGQPAAQVGLGIDGAALVALRLERAGDVAAALLRGVRVALGEEKVLALDQCLDDLRALSLTGVVDKPPVIETVEERVARLRMEAHRIGLGQVQNGSVENEAKDTKQDCVEHSRGGGVDRPGPADGM